ncbi:nuclear transport factor 2 family protein [Siphonobacter sp.]|uniref:nuclear transport factor 2 family protein n=1 Tax=Siphonobacter sp. TaxID=1869184 RepID=UPI003B3B7294
MKKTLVLVVSMALLTLTAMAQSKEETAVTQAVEQLKAAMIKGDKADLMAITHDRLNYGHSSGLIEDKALFVENLTNGNSVFKSINLSDQTVTVVGSTALVRHTLAGETANKGQAGQVKLGVLLTWVKEKGKWLLLGRQAYKI